MFFLFGLCVGCCYSNTMHYNNDIATLSVARFACVLVCARVSVYVAGERRDKLNRHHFNVKNSVSLSGNRFGINGEE